MVFNGARLKILQTIKGELPKNQQVVYLLIIFGWHYALLFFSIIVYPTSYNIFDNFISDLGMPERNPKGYILFIINAVSMGFLLIPHILYLFKSLLPYQHELFKLGVRSGVVGCVANIFVGIFPENFTSFLHNFPHLLAMFIDYAGFTISSLTMLTVIIHKKKANPKKGYHFSVKFWLVPFLPGLLYIFIRINFILFSLNTYLPSLNVFWWEWMGVLTMEFWIISAIFVTPEKPIIKIDEHLNKI